MSQLGRPRKLEQASKPSAMTTDAPLAGKHVLLGISAGIAAYKMPELVRMLLKAGASVRVVMTKNAHYFVTETTLRTLTSNPVITDVFAEPASHKIDHIAYAQEADVYLVAPATADVIAKFAAGIADDMVTSTFLSCRCPILIAPAMNETMWENPATANNVQTLRSRGIIIVEPEVGELACGDVGKGRLAALESLMAAVAQAVNRSGDLAGLRLLVTAGPTREPLDAVRFISNRSSGKMGYAIAQRAAERGAEVHLVSGPTNLPPPPGVDLTLVETAEEMKERAEALFPDCHGFIAAAAVSDFRASKPKAGKWDKSQGPPVLTLEVTPDVLAWLSSKKKEQVTIGFAAEAGESLERAREKLREKNLDLIVVNDISRQDIGFESDFNEVSLVSPWGSPVRLPKAPKAEIADAILSRLMALARDKGIV